jgi:hypothetical protein
VLDQAGVEHVPGRQADAPAHHHREADAVQQQSDDELRQPPGKPAGAELGDEAQLGEGRCHGRRHDRHASMILTSGLERNSHL